RLCQSQATLPAGEERARDLREVAFHGRERLREAALDRLRQLAAELVELGERALEVAALRPQLLEVLILALVLLLRERVDAAERLEAAGGHDAEIQFSLEPLDRPDQPRVRVAHAGLRSGRPLREVASLRPEQPELRLELELDRFGRLPGEPELTAIGVVADALLR